MYAQQKSSGDAKKLRQKGGVYLANLRTKAGLTQRELAVSVGMKYYTFVSQIETGDARIPPDKYEAYAKTVGVSSQEFAKHMLLYYDPFTYKCLFGSPDMAGV